MQSRLRLKRSPSFAGGAWSWHHCFKTRLSSRQQVRFAADAKSPDDGRQEQAQRHSETGTTSQGRQDSEQAKSESEMWSEMWRTKRDAETQALPQALRAQLDTISKLYRRAELSNAALFGGVAVMAVTSGFLYMNWQDVRQHVSKESAGMVAETIRDKQLQNDAHEFSKALLNHLLTDEEVSRTVARWTYGILQSLKNEIGDLFVHILALEQVVAAVNRLADRLVEHLCSSRTIQERVGKLLVDAICLETSRDAAARWAYDLVMRDDVKSGFRDLVVGALQTDAVVEEARGLAIQIVNTVLNDPNTQNEARRALNETLRDSELRATAKDSLWSIVMPWSGSSKATDKPVQKALKSLDDILMLDSLTQDEKQVLLSLQNRLRTEGEAPSRRHSKNVSVDAVASSAGAEHSPKEEAARKALEEKEAQEKAQRKAEEAAKKLADQRAAEEEAARKAAEQTEAKEKAERQEVARKALAEKIAKEEAERELAKRIAEEKAAKEEAARVAEAARKAQEKAEREAEAARKAAEENAAKEAAELEAARRAAEEKAAEEQAKREAEELARKEAEETIARKLAEADAKKAMEEKVAKEKAELEEAEESARRNAAAEKKAVEDVARKLADEAAEQSALAREAEEKAVALQASSHEAAAAKAAEQTALAREAGERAAALREVAEEAAKEAAAKDAEQRKYSEEASKKIPGQPTAFQRFAEQAAQVVHGVVDPFTGESKPGDEDPTKTSR